MTSNNKKGLKLYHLLCEWDDCDTPSYHVSMEEYVSYANHLRMHIDSSINVANAVYARLKAQTAESGLVFTCEWKGCNIELFNDTLHFTRHVMYHGYHSTLKDKGKQEQEKSKYGPCQLDEETKNYLPDLSDPFICCWDNCGTEFQCPLEFFRHVDAHTLRTEISLVEDNRGNSGEDIYLSCYICKWTDCNCTFKTVYKLKEHCRVHTHEKLIACPNCGGFFANRTKFIDHLSRQDADAYENFQCSHCLRRCASERLLRDHMRHHVNHLKCPHCDMTCPNPSSLRDHFKFRHSEERPFVCNICNFRCKTASDLQRHEETHLGKQYVCGVDGCTFTTKTIQYLKNHHKSKHETDIAKRFVCHICDSRYTRGTGLTTHLKAKHNFRWPSGHPRFRYKEYEDGLYRLQMVRFESAELTEKLAEGEILDEECVEEVIDIQEQEGERSENAEIYFPKKFLSLTAGADYVDSNGVMQEQVVFQNDGSYHSCVHGQDNANGTVLPFTSIQDSVATIDGTIATTSTLTSSAEQGSDCYATVTEQHTSAAQRNDLSLELLQMATVQGAINFGFLQRNDSTITKTQTENQSSPVPFSLADALPSTISNECSIRVPSVYANRDNLICSDEQSDEQNKLKHKKGTKSPKTRKRKRLSPVKRRNIKETTEQQGEDFSDYDQRLDISHTLLSLQTTGLVRL